MAGSFDNLQVNIADEKNITLKQNAFNRAGAESIIRWIKTPAFRDGMTDSFLVTSTHVLGCLPRDGNAEPQLLVPLKGSARMVRLSMGEEGYTTVTPAPGIARMAFRTCSIS